LTFFSGAEVEAKRQVLLILQDHIRNAVSAAKLVPRIVEATISSDYNEVEELYRELRRVDEESARVQKSFVGELLSVGPLLTSREELLRLVSMVGSITDSLEGAAYRITHFHVLRSAPRDLLERLLGLAKKVEDTVNSLRECIFLLSYNPSGIVEAGKDVALNEGEVDMLYRALSTMSLEAKIPPSLMLAINEVINRLEEASDMTLRALNVVTILLM
jgi:uncharacterized protein Yka (UPF0111/DUF47 family)